MCDLDGARIKLRRARRHIDELTREARAYLDSEPFQLTRFEEPNGDLAYRVKVQNEVPHEWSAIIGDVVHNLRSALDLLAWQLVEIAGGTPGRETCFPIGHSSGYRRTLRRALGGASPRARRFVRRLRPHTGGNGALLRLHALNISDKHRLVLVVGAAHKHVAMKMKMPVPWQEEDVEFPPIALQPADRQFPLRDGASVFTIRAAARTPSEPEPEVQIAFELAFGDVNEVRGLPLLETLDDMHRHVGRIIDIADRYFFA